MLFLLESSYSVVCERINGYMQDKAQKSPARCGRVDGPAMDFIYSKIFAFIVPYIPTVHHRYVELPVIVLHDAFKGD